MPGDRRLTATVLIERGFLFFFIIFAEKSGGGNLPRRPVGASADTANFPPSPGALLLISPGEVFSVFRSSSA